MITASNKAVGLDYSRYLVINALDEETLDRAKDIFRYYCEKGVILHGKFEDNRWQMTDEKSRTVIRFDYENHIYEERAQKWIECGSECYREAVKAYIVFLMGSRTITALRELSGKFCEVAGSEYPEGQGFKDDSYHIAEMLRLIPGESDIRDSAIDFLDECYREFCKKTGNQRKMLDFPAYFQFHDAITEFWGNADNKKKRYYFPLYLWWNLTAVLPLRVTEFLMLPAECIKKAGSGYTITVRRTRLKGSSKRMTYRIDDDYEKKTYPVSGELAQWIAWYQSETEQEDHSPYDLLFCMGPYKQYRGNAVQEIFNYDCLMHLKEDLYRDELPEDLPKVNFGDTRHIAMMNLIISGGSPRICMELAGHANIGISSHYYANMTSLVECVTYELYRKNRNGAAARVSGSRYYSLEPTEGMIRLADGWCRSEKLKVHKIDDCILAVNSLGEIGDCRSCRYFRRDSQGAQIEFFNTNHSKNKVKSDSWFLMQMFEAVRSGIGCQEDINQAILRLQNSCSHYRECLWRELEVNQNGKT